MKSVQSDRIMRLKDYSAWGEWSQYNNELVDLGFWTSMGPIVTSEGESPQVDTSSPEALSDSVARSLPVQESILSKIQQVIDVVSKVLTLIEWIEAHTKNCYDLNKYSFKNGVYNDDIIGSTAYQKIAFDSVHWKARLLEVIDNNDIVLLSVMDLDYVKEESIKNHAELLKVCTKLKTDSFYFLKPLIYGSQKKFRRYATKYKYFKDGVKFKYNKVKVCLTQKVPFLFKVITTPTEDIVNFKLHSYDSHKISRRNKDDEFDDIYNKFRALCE